MNRVRTLHFWRETNEVHGRVDTGPADGRLGGCEDGFLRVEDSAGVGDALFRMPRAQG